MTVEDLAVDRYKIQQALADRAAADAAEIWNDIDGDDIRGSWTDGQVGDRLFVATSTAQRVGVEAGLNYVGMALEEQGVDLDDEWVINGDALAGVASDGRDLDGLLLSPVVSTMFDLGQGMPVDQALERGGVVLDRIVDTQVTDAGRTADLLGMATQRRAMGYVRMVNPGACSRCVILAGKTFLWNEGFERHPKCQCVHVPYAEQSGITDDVRIDPQGYFDSLTRQQQDRAFTKAGAEAIRLGADMNQVVNVRRGASGLSTPGRLTAAEQTMMRGGRQRGSLQRVDVFGRKLAITTEGVSVRGVAGKRMAQESGVRRGRRYRRAKEPRLMPEAIMELADGDRDEALRLLERFGYIAR